MGATLSSGLLESMLYQVKSTDPLNLVMVSALMLSAAVLGTAVPLQRALRIAPAETIRN
ncbi:MAG: hypothetical protein WEE89_19410 [Gemmatimonadota bacterium]